MERQKLEYLDKLSRELGVKLIPTEEVRVGDLYFGYKNTTPKLLECMEVRGSIVVPTTADYWFDWCDCVKVEYF